MFRYMAGLDRGAAIYERSGRTRTCSPPNGDWAAALAVLDDGRDFDRGERWGVYNIQRLYLEFLAALGMREETVPGDPVRARARLLPAREVQPGDLGLRGDLLQHRACAEVRVVREVARVPGSRLLRGVGRRRRLRDARRGHARDRAPGQGDAVAGGLLPCLRKNRFPSKRQGGLGLFHVIPDAAIADADRYRGTVEDETRLFYVAVTRAQKYLFVSFSPGAEPALQDAVGLLRPLCAPAVVLDQGHRRAGRRAAARAAAPGTRRRRSRCRSRS